MIKKEKACCFTGHRKIPKHRLQNMIINLDREIEILIEQGITDFISGGALGFDQIAASLIVAKKEKHKNIRLIFALPCKNHDEFWSENQRTLYKSLLCEADEIIYITQEYADGCMKKRNRYIVEHSLYCVCALLYEKSGTGQTVRFARRKGLKVVNVTL